MDRSTDKGNQGHHRDITLTYIFEARVRDVCEFERQRERGDEGDAPRGRDHHGDVVARQQRLCLERVADQQHPGNNGHKGVCSNCAFVC